jgi:hypothetical protein
VPAEICREIESVGLTKPGVPLTAPELRRLFFGLCEGNRRMSIQGADDFNTVNRLRSQLKRAEERIRELEAALKASMPSATDGQPDASTLSATADPSERAK